MSRHVPGENSRGSLKWIQRAAGTGWLDADILAHVHGASNIKWRSPIAADQFAEYRDADFLDRVSLSS